MAHMTQYRTLPSQGIYVSDPFGGPGEAVPGISYGPDMPVLMGCSPISAALNHAQPCHAQFHPKGPCTTKQRMLR